jgi:DNA-binding winged helix-turn-helix (wHTH) protein
MPVPPSVRRFRFGIFELDTASGEPRKAGIRVRLQDQPFQVLVLLLEKPGEVLTRDELRQKLWPDGTFVDFDHSLNSTINKLREVLGDSASNPRFIETLARRGYRFLLPVTAVDKDLGASPRTSSEASALTEPSPEKGPKSFLTRAEDVPVVPHAYIRVLFLLIQIMYMCFYIAALARLSPMQDIVEQVFRLPASTIVIVIVSAAIGIPVRLYVISATAFNVRDFGRKFLRIFIPVVVLDELWALAPFLLVRQIGWGLSLAATAALIYVPFAQRTLSLMRERAHQGG